MDSTFPEYPYEYVDEETGEIKNPGKIAPSYQQYDTPAGRITRRVEEGALVCKECGFNSNQVDVMGVHLFGHENFPEK